MFVSFLACPPVTVRTYQVLPFWKGSKCTSSYPKYAKGSGSKAAEFAPPSFMPLVTGRTVGGWKGKVWALVVFNL